MSLLPTLLLSFLPHSLTSFALPYLSAYLPHLFPPAPIGSPRYRLNYRWAFTSLMALYLGCTWFGETAQTGDENETWYSLLGVSMEADEDTLRRAFRTLSRVHHPDRAGSAGEQVFIQIRVAYEGLSDPLKRYAYDRFGPDILSWKAATMREFMRQGIMRSSGFYLVSTAITILLSLLGRAREGAFWRNLALVCLGAAELHLILAPHPPRQFLLSSRRPPFLLIRFLHRVFTTASIGITQLAGVWTDEKLPSDEAAWAQLRASLRNLEHESSGAFQETVVPLLIGGQSHEVEQMLRAGMQQALVDRALSSHPQIRPIWLEAVGQTQRVRHVQHTQEDVELARRIPLPPSPPPTPPLEPRRLPGE